MWPAVARVGAVTGAARSEVPGALDPDGDLDTSFGALDVGWMTLALDLGGGNHDRGDIRVVQGDNKIVVVARAATAAGEDFAVAWLPNDYVFADALESGALAAWWRP